MVLAEHTLSGDANAKPPNRLWAVPSGPGVSAKHIGVAKTGWDSHSL